MLDPAGRVAGAERLILVDALAIMLLIVVPLLVAIPLTAWWFRAGNQRAHRKPEWSFSGHLELLIWSVPTLIVIFIGGIAWAGSHSVDPARPLDASPLAVEVVSLDWKWLFIYPEQGVASVNHLIVPVGRSVHFRLTSATVMNSFFVPRLGSQIYTMPGMVTKLNLAADRPGSYRGLSANYSGDGFADMAFRVDAVSPATFASWAQKLRAEGSPLDHQTYGALGDPSIAGTATFRLTSARLFDEIVSDGGKQPRRRNVQGATR